MSYKKNLDSNRDALFGGAGSKGSTSKSNKKPSANLAPAASSTSRSSSAIPTNQGYQAGAAKSSSSNKPRLTEQALAAKMKEAQEYRDKANKCMERGFFKSADPVAASTFFKRAADCYQVLGDLRTEQYMRLASADCNFQVRAWATAANDFTRAAELVLQQLADDEDDDDKTSQARRDASDYHKKAAEAWTQMDEKAKAAQSQIHAALAILGSTSTKDESKSTLISKEALKGLEEAVEAHVPDVLNPYARYRQTGRSAFLNEGETADNCSPETRQLAEAHIVSRAYAHEPLQEVVHMLVRHGEYLSALYAAGAATVILERDNTSTLSLSRAYCTETILMLAGGDPIAAEERFLQRHVQKTFYLSSRECKLSEDLFRAIKIRDGDALEEARDPSGSNRAALANLHASLRQLVSELRLSGVARKKLPGEEQPASGGKKATTNKKPPPSSQTSKEAPAPSAPVAPDKSLNEILQGKTGYEKDVQEGQHLDGEDLQDELDALDLGDEGSGSGLEDDDDFDLR